MPIGIPNDKRLFRFEVFVTSKQLGDALAALSGRVAQVTPPQLVANASAGRDGVTPISSGQLVELFATWLRQHKVTEFNNQKTKEFLNSVGRSPNSASYLQTKAKEHGLIKNVGNTTESRWQLKPASKPRPKKPAAKPVATS